ncbi:hypothetical protein HDU82_000994 [Entophlyctis luteolus]|nr:hypothetical protein HDU82_000994 [Entophlyctis luteolus]
MFRTPWRTGVSSLFAISLRPPIAAAASASATKDRPTQPRTGSRIVSLMHRAASRVMARAVAEDVYSGGDNAIDGSGGSYFSHEFIVGAERAVEEFVRRAARGDVAAVAQMASPFVVRDVEQLMRAGGIRTESSEAPTFFAVRHLRVGNPRVRYGCGGSTNGNSESVRPEHRVVKSFRDGSRLLANTASGHTSSSNNTHYVYEWHNLQWVFPRWAVVAARHEIDDEFFTRHSGNAMRKGFVVGVDVYVDVDVADAANASRRRRIEGLRVSFESGVHCPPGDVQSALQNSGHMHTSSAVAGARNWRICDAGDVVECLLLPMKP